MESFFSPVTANSSQVTKRPREDNKSPVSVPLSAPMTIDALAALILPKLDQINSNVADMRGLLNEVEGRVEVLEDTVATQAAQIKSLTRENSKLLDELRRTNLLIHGLPESETDLLESVKSLFETKLGVKAEVDTVFRLGKPLLAKNRPVKVRFTHMSSRSAVFAKRLTLTDATPKILITEDLSLSTREERKEAWERRQKKTTELHEYPHHWTTEFKLTSWPTQLRSRSPLYSKYAFFSLFSFIL